MKQIMNQSYVQLRGSRCLHVQESGLRSVVRSCIMPGLPRNLVQELNVGTVVSHCSKYTRR